MCLLPLSPLRFLLRMVLDIANDNYYMPFKKIVHAKKKEEERDVSEKLEQTVSAFVRVSLFALVFPHGVPIEVPLDGLKILNNLIIKTLFFFHAREHSYSPYARTL